MATKRKKRSCSHPSPPTPTLSWDWKFHEKYVCEISSNLNLHFTYLHFPWTFKNFFVSMTSWKNTWNLKGDLSETLNTSAPLSPDPSFPGAPFFRISWNTMCSENIIKEVRSQVELGLGWSWTVRLFWKTLSVVLEELLLWILMSFDIFFSSRLSIFNRNRVNFWSACIFKVWCP